MNTLALAALALLLPSFAAAQDAAASAQASETAPAAVRKDQAAVAGDRRVLAQDRAGLQGDEARLKGLTRQEAASKAELRAKERASVDAVRADASLTEAQKKARIKGIHQDYRSRLKSLGAQDAGQKKALHEAIAKDKAGVGDDRARMKKDRAGLQQDRRAERGREKK